MESKLKNTASESHSFVTMIPGVRFKFSLELQASMGRSSLRSQSRYKQLILNLERISRPLGSFYITHIKN